MDLHQVWCSNMSKKFEDEFQPGAGVCSTVSSLWW